MSQRKLGFEISLCARKIRHYIDTNTAKYHADELTGTHGRAIGYFYRNKNKNIFQKDFEKEFDIRRSTASNILALMEKNGLITRENIPDDARLKKIVLTEKAELMHKEIEKNFEKMEQELCKNITEEEMEAFFATIDKIKNNIERMNTGND